MLKINEEVLNKAYKKQKKIKMNIFNNNNINNIIKDDDKKVKLYDIGNSISEVQETDNAIHIIVKPVSFNFENVLLFPTLLLNVLNIKNFKMNKETDNIYDAIFYGHCKDNDNNTYNSTFNSNTLAFMKSAENTDVKLNSVILYGVFESLDIMNEIIQEIKRVFSPNTVKISYKSDIKMDDGKLYNIFSLIKDQILDNTQYGQIISYKLVPMTLYHNIIKFYNKINNI